MTLYYICDLCGNEIETQYIDNGINTITWELDDGDTSTIGHYHRKCANIIAEKIKALKPSNSGKELK
jgi:hypothetical protein